LIAPHVELSTGVGDQQPPRLGWQLLKFTYAPPPSGKVIVSEQSTPSMLPLRARGSATILISVQSVVEVPKKLTEPR
jgi:hypothetical protein